MIAVNFFGRLPKGIRPVLITEAIRRSFKSARRVECGSVAVGCVSEIEIAFLNKKYRHKNKPTDVLSFAAPASDRDGEKEWGDIVLAPSYARHEAERRGVGFEEEMIRLVVHGLLHLFGYDHATASDEEQMFSLQEKIVGQTLGS